MYLLKFHNSIIYQSYLIFFGVISRIQMNRTLTNLFIIIYLLQLNGLDMRFYSIHNCIYIYIYIYIYIIIYVYKTSFFVINKNSVRILAHLNFKKTMNQLVVVLDLIVLRNNLNVELYKCRSIYSYIQLYTVH